VRYVAFAIRWECITRYLRQRKICEPLSCVSCRRWGC